MASEYPPYVQAYGNITKVLNKIVEASTPPRFTQDFLETKLAMKGGSARPVIPFLKRSGFLGSDGVPTDLYKQFRNSAKQGGAAAIALKTGYSNLYEVNEYVHDASDKDLKGLIVQVTGLAPDSSTVKSIVGSFKALKDFAKFDGEEIDEVEEEESVASEAEPSPETRKGSGLKTNVGLSYTINLNLPPTSDIAVFDAIFKSLKEHILK